MTRRKNNKRALLLSCLSLLLCMAMLVGSTFAWFTDEASTGVNTIQAGNLDIGLYKGTVSETGISYEEVVNEQTKLFNDEALWEPGYTEVAYLKVDNVGDLAVKALLTVNFAKQEKGTSVLGNDILLSDYLWYDLVEITENEFYSDRDAARAAAKAGASKIATEQNEIKLKPTDEAKYYALVVYMPEDVGNEANYRGETAPSIELCVTLLATQDTVEADSFDNQYDAQASYPESIKNNEGLFEALASSDNVTIKSGNYELPFAIPDGKTLNVEGGDFTVDKNKDGAAFSVGEDSSLNISTSNVITEGYKVAVHLAKEGANVTINDGTYVSSSIQVLHISAANATLTINNGTVKGTSGVWCDSDDAIIVINGGDFNVSALVMGDDVPTTPVKITGGNFKIGANGFDAGQNTPFVITGGTFSKDPSQYVDTTAYDVTETDGWYTVTAK